MYYLSNKRFVDFCDRNKLFVLFSAVLMAVAYGGKLVYQTVSMDMELLLDHPATIYSQWIANHKWGLIAYKWATGTMSYNMALEAFLLILNLIVASVAFGFMFDALGRRENRASIYAFSALFLTHPVWGEQYINMSQAAGISFAMIVAVISVLLFLDGLKSNKKPYFVFAVLIGTFCFGFGDAFVYLMGVLLLAVFILAMRDNRMDRKARFVLLGKFVLFYIIMLGIAALISLAISNDLGNGDFGGYMAVVNHWGVDSIPECLLAIGAGLKNVILARDICYNVLFTASIIAGFATYGITKSKYKGAKFTLFAMIIMCICPFIPLVQKAAEPLISDGYVISFVAAFLCFYVIDEATVKWLVWCLSIPAFYIAFRQIETVQRISYTEYVRYNQDVAIVENIWTQISALQIGSIDDVPVVIVGELETELNKSCVEKRDTALAGRSIFEVEPLSHSRVNALFRILGHQVANPTEEQYEQAEEMVSNSTMYQYPNQGYVQYSEGMIIVNMGLKPVLEGEEGKDIDPAAQHAANLIGGE